MTMVSTSDLVPHLFSSSPKIQHCSAASVVDRSGDEQENKQPYHQQLEYLSLTTTTRVDKALLRSKEPMEHFSLVSKFGDQVNDKGFTMAKVVAQQKLEKTLMDLDSHLKPGLMLAAQLWVPTQVSNQDVLRCSQSNVTRSWNKNKQKFMLDVTTKYLGNSFTRVFSCDGKSGSSNSNITDTLDPYLSTSKEVTYLLNRQVSVSAFRLRSPQWAPNLHIYKSHGNDYLQSISSKQNYAICRTLAIPVFEPYSDLCIGVCEVLMASTDNDYEVVDRIGNLLKAVNLRADTQFYHQPRYSVLDDILKAITKVCEDHELPLAQTWKPCLCRDQTCNFQQLCMVNAELPFYMRDKSIYGFWHDSTKYHMRQGQAVAGTAFFSKGMCLCRDITRFPDHFSLVHLSREFQLSCSLAICLRSGYSSNDVYVVQFFWSRMPNSTLLQDDELVLSISATLKQVSDKLHLVSSVSEELEAETERIIDRQDDSKIQGDIDDVFAYLATNISNGNMVQPEEVSMLDEDSKQKTCEREGADWKGKKKATKQRRNVSMIDLLPCLGGTLKDAARHLGISKSTLKRKCKELKIENWQEERKRKGLQPPMRRKRSSNKRKSVVVSCST